RTLDCLQLDEGGTRLAHPNGGRVEFINGDVRTILRQDANSYHRLPWFGDVFHLAAVVRGRSNIDGNPLSVAACLAIDAEFFAWASRTKPGRILYASSSAVYPVQRQTRDSHVALREDMVNFESGSLGIPDMTYGWAKLTGEYLATVAAQHHGLNV